MYCPKCKKEFKEGIYLCGDCRTSLVPELQPDPLKEPQECDEFEEILFSSNAFTTPRPCGINESEKSTLALLKPIIGGYHVVQNHRSLHSS